MTTEAAPDYSGLIASMREWAMDDSSLCYVMKGSAGAVAIFKDDIESKDDAELIAFIKARTA